MQEHYTENFVQSTLSAMGDKLKGCSLVVGGDGRYYGKEATEKNYQDVCSKWGKQTYCSKEHNFVRVCNNVELCR